MNAHGFFSKLFDFTFKEFITLQIVKYLYIIGLVFAGISALGFAGAGISDLRYDVIAGLVKILLSPFAFALTAILIRLVLEALVATFRIAENTTKIVENQENKGL
ncbi:hypothetical protein CR164_07480 [Prosthecochloris marina]|uniref:DUF4282 domain-containing protein n=1 Tax=Prosthecochloris marina TaxID=2017681 RepID=A0A317T6E9_9CHLB|nr:DUF4282 domain-containing protein [Prosthecochloris marina]PWW82165.1 hypothetical protein CR164_07480 [Prosthecochloris marina]